MEGFVQMETIEYHKEEIEKWKAEALQAAKNADEVVLFMGEHYLQSGEAASRTYIEIPSVQMELFRAVHEVNPNICLVLFNGRPLDLREVSEKAKAILVAWFPGTMAGVALWDVLTGEYAPSGKLPMSFPYNVGQVPIHYDILPTGRPWTPADAQERFVSKYLDAPNQPLYSFGYGLSYTKFMISPVDLSAEGMTKDDVISASVTVKNIGEREGTETVQLYLHDIAASVARPVKQLKGFKKVTLKAREEKRVTFSISETMLRFLREDGIVGSEPGTFEVFIGSDSQTENKAVFELKESCCCGSQ